MKKITILISVFIAGLFFISASESSENMEDIRDFDLSVKTKTQDIQAAGTVKPDLDFGKFPLYFIYNKGQVNEKARYYAKASRYTLWMTKEGLIFDSIRGQGSGVRGQDEKATPPHSPTHLTHPLTKYQRDVSRLSFIGANKNPEMVPIDNAKLKVNYFIGNDKSKWFSDIPTSKGVLYKDLYKGIDLKVYGIEKQIEYDWIVKPGGNPEDIRFEYKDVNGTRIDNDGNLIIETDFGELLHKCPVSYQEIDKKKIVVKAAFKKISKNIYGFEVNEYDRNYELIIDPMVLAYSTYLGGNGDDYGEGIAVDNSGNVYVTGWTSSTNFPTKNQYQTDQTGIDAFVTKIDTTKSGNPSLIYSTYLGGNANDYVRDLAADNCGNAYITGITESTNFPTLNQYQLNMADEDAFVTKIDTTTSGISSLNYSTYLGGGSYDAGWGIAADNSGNVYVTGWTNSTNFPTKNQYQTDQTGMDAFVTKIDTTKSGNPSLIYSTYLGGNDDDYGDAIAADSYGNAYITGLTHSTNFPTKNQYQDNQAWDDAFVTKINTTGSGASSLIYSTYLGGGGSDSTYGIAADNSGNAYVTGETLSADFPTKNQYQSFQWSLEFKAFVTKIDTTSSGSSSLGYSTYLGGTENDYGLGIAVDNNGNAYVTGCTYSTDFPTKYAYQSNLTGSAAFVTRINTLESGILSLIYSTYLGGGGYEVGSKIAVDNDGNAYVTGDTSSINFPTENQYQNDQPMRDVFVTRLEFDGPLITVTSPNGGESWDVGSTHDITWTSTGSVGNVKLEYTTDNGSNWTVFDATALNDGVRPWVVPNTPSTNCEIRISETDGCPSDTSDSVFSIAAAATSTITVTSPNGGESWEGGSTHNITWTSTGPVGSVKLEVTTDNGSNWTVFDATALNDGVRPWVVPNTPSSNCKIRISETDGSPSDTSDSVFSIVPSTPPQISLNRTQIYFGAATSGISTSSQSLFVDNSGGGTLNWSITDDATWLNCSPSSGTNAGSVTVSVDVTGLSAGTYTGTITVSDSTATNSPQTVSVTLDVYGSGQNSLPFGLFETPTHNSTVMSSISVSGWALDDIGVESVKIYRQAGSILAYIGDAVFVEGARPDVEQAFPGYPKNYQAGWGYMLLTNFLPNSGNGTFILYAKATDMEGQEVTLGTKTIHCDNANAVKPFGAIDTPTQGGTANGSSYTNWGWVLTPQPNSIPTDGSTIQVLVDSVSIGNPTYNVYRADIATLFPGYANSNGAVGYFSLDTTAYNNGVHTIAWIATDSGGNADGIGSRYFTIQNSGSSRSVSKIAGNNQWKPIIKIEELSNLPFNYFEPIKMKKGYGRNVQPRIIQSDERNIFSIEIRELERIELHISNVKAGYMLAGNKIHPLPIGSTLYTKNGTFSWIPGPGFYGNYRLIFVVKDQNGELSKQEILVSIAPKFGIRN